MGKSLTSTLRALRHRNYRLFFYGQVVSLTGTWIQTIAMSWLVYRLTGSAFLLGLTGFASQIPILLFSPFAGIWTDRVNRRRILLVTQTLAMLQAFTLALLVFSGHVAAWHVIALALLLGTIMALDAPARQSFLVFMVDDRADLPNAIALNSFMFNAARLVGPSIAGVLIAAFGESICFLLNGLSYAGVLAALLAMNVQQPAPKAAPEHWWLGMRRGFSYAFGFPPIRFMLLLLALVSFMATPYLTLMPIFAAEVFHGGAATLGLLIGAAGFGAIGATIYLASRASVAGLSNVIPVGAALAGIALILFTRSVWLWLSIPLMIAAGFGIIVQLASINTVLQTIVDEDKRGRVMSLYTMAYLGVMPLGSLAAGRLAQSIGAPDTLLLGGVCCVLGAALFATRLSRIRELIRPIFLKRGIIPSS